MNMQYCPPPVKKPSLVMSWLGFGLSSALFVLVWSVTIFLIYAMSQPGESHAPQASHAGAGFLMLMFLGCTLLGLTAMLFSIVGLFSADLNNLKKWPSVSGIILCIASPLSIFAPPLYACMAPSEPIVVQTPPTVKAHDTAKTEGDILIEINFIGDFKLKDIRPNSTTQDANIDKYSHSKKRQIKTWMQMNGLTTENTVVIRTDPDTDYSDVLEIIDLLNELGIKRFSMETHKNQ